jgi:hypothetical protein
VRSEKRDVYRRGEVTGRSSRWIFGRRDDGEVAWRRRAAPAQSRIVMLRRDVRVRIIAVKARKGDGACSCQRHHTTSPSRRASTTWELGSRTHKGSGRYKENALRRLTLAQARPAGLPPDLTPVPPFPPEVHVRRRRFRPSTHEHARAASEVWLHAERRETAREERGPGSTLVQRQRARSEVGRKWTARERGAVRLRRREDGESHGGLAPHRSRTGLAGKAR